MRLRHAEIITSAWSNGGISHGVSNLSILTQAVNNADKTHHRSYYYFDRTILNRLITCNNKGYINMIINIL